MSPISTAPQNPLAPLEDLEGVADAVQEASQALAKVHRHPANLRGWDVTGSESVLRGARASALIDGGSVEIPDDGRVTDPILAGALRVAGMLAPDGITDTQITWRHAPLQVVARMNALASPVQDGQGDASSTTLAQPHTEASARMQLLSDMITFAQPVSAVVLSAVIHGELLGLAPFDHANGVTARGASRLATIASGLDPRGLGVPEVWWSKDREGYQRRAQAFATGTPDAVGEWIIYHAQGLVQGAREGASIAEAKQS